MGGSVPEGALGARLAARWIFEPELEEILTRNAAEIEAILDEYGVPRVGSGVAEEGA